MLATEISFVPLEGLFTVLNAIVLPGWALLLVAPRWAWTRRLILAATIPFLALTYVLLLASTWGTAEGDFSSLEGVGLLFQEPRILLAGWVHYLTFDLLTGLWETQESLRRGIPHWLLAPCLVVTLFFGPIGLGLFLIVRPLFQDDLDRP
ncbi:MAG: DUF4281 domain-containing protein [Acidobacteria bacterium]|nr:DUF4281 domain-containing protein [Acidobacteriota bacterium]